MAQLNSSVLLITDFLVNSFTPVPFPPPVNSPSSETFTVILVALLLVFRRGVKLPSGKQEKQQ